MKKILISNDDGVFAEGINTLAKAMRCLADVDVIAPDRNRSGASTSLTLDRPVRVHAIDKTTYSVEGTPTDCVHLALSGLLKTMPDVVISGINHGANLGDDVWYSGTVAAAIEGRFLGLPSLAVSLASKNWSMTHFDTAAKVVQKLLKHVTETPLPANTILNINVPDIPFEQIEGIEITRLGARHRSQDLIKQKDPRGHNIYWVGMPSGLQDAGQGTDFYAIEHNRVSMTPLQIDLTHYKAFEQLASWARAINITAEN